LQTELNKIHSEPNPSFFKNRTETEQKFKNLFRTSLQSSSSRLATRLPRRHQISETAEFFAAAENLQKKWICKSRQLPMGAKMQHWNSVSDTHQTGSATLTQSLKLCCFSDCWMRG